MLRIWDPDVLRIISYSNVIIEAAASFLIMYGILGFRLKATHGKRLFSILLSLGILFGLNYIMNISSWGLSVILYWAVITIPLIVVFGRKTWGCSFMSMVITLDIGRAVREIYMIASLENSNCREVMVVGEIAGAAIAMACAALFSIILRKRKKHINILLQNEKQTFYFCIGIFLVLPQMGFWQSAIGYPFYIQNIAAKTVFNALLFLCLIAVCVMCIMLYRQRSALKRQIVFNQRCIREQTEQYVFLRNTQQELRKFRHDNIAHLSTIQYMAQSGEDDKISAYVTELLNSQEIVKYYDTGNIIGDAVINQYYRMCRDAGIEAVVAGRLVEGIQVTETDLCVILTNIIANAYEAALAAEKKLLRIELSNFQSKQFIRVANTAKDHVDIKDGELSIKRSSKAERDSHGFGIQNIKEAVHRAGGSVKWYKGTESDVQLIVAEVELKVG